MSATSEFYRENKGIHMATQGLSDDYAHLSAGGAEFYYGYESTDSNGEWCFYAKIDGEPVLQVPKSILSGRDLGDPVEYLLVGIGRVLDACKLVQRE